MKGNNENKREINDFTVSRIESFILNITTDLVPNDDSVEEYSHNIFDDLEILEKDKTLFPSLFPLSEFEKLENNYQNSALVSYF